MRRQPPTVAAVAAFLARLTSPERPVVPLGLERPDGALSARIDDYFTRCMRGGFAGAVLVVRDGRVVLRRGYGLADDRRRVPITPDTVFEMASISKQFTAAAILLLESKGLLAVSDPIRKHLPGVPADKAGVTLHALLTHTAGLGENHIEDDLAPMTRGEALEAILAAPMRHPPGARFAYSNSGFTLLAAIVEEVSGTTFERYLRGEIFDAAGLESTGFPGEARWQGRTLAHGYMNGADLGSPASWPASSWGTLGGARVLSTVGDLHAWVTRLRLRDGGVLPPSAVDRMFRRWVRDADAFYGYGWSLADTVLGPMIEHDGGGPGGNSDVAYYPDAALVVAIAGNRITWQGALGVPIVIRLPATEARERLQRNLATGDFAPMPRPTFSIVPYGASAAARLTGMAKAARTLVRVARGDAAPPSTRRGGG